MVLTVPREHYRPSPLLPSAINVESHDLDRAFALKDLFNPFTKEPCYDHCRLTAKYSRETLVQILERNYDTVFFKESGLNRALAPFFDSQGKVFSDKYSELVQAFCSQTKITSYEDYEPYVHRMFHFGETNLLNKLPPDYWIKTSGTTCSSPKTFPFYPPEGFLERWAEFPSCHVIGTVHALSGFSNFSTRSRGIDLLFKASQHAPSPNGVSVVSVNSLFQPSPNDIEPLEAKSILSPILRLRVALIFALRESNLEYIRCIYLLTLVDFFTVMESDWDILLNSIESGVLPDCDSWDQDLKSELESQLEARPSRAAYLRSITKQQSFEGIVPHIWPHLALIVGAFSSNFMVHRRACQFYTTRSPFYIESGYSCSEANIGYAIGLLSNHHVLNIKDNFLEFIPAGTSDDPVQACDLQVGREYKPVLTTFQSCLTRYCLGDVVRMMGWYNHLPVVQLIRRRLDSLTIRGANLYEEALVRALDSTCLNRSFFSCFEDNSVSPSRLGFYIELVRDQYIKQADGRWNAASSLEELESATDCIHEYLNSTSAVYKSAMSDNQGFPPLKLIIVPPNTFNELSLVQQESRCTGRGSSPTFASDKIPLGIYEHDQLQLLETASNQIDLS